VGGVSIHDCVIKKKKKKKKVAMKMRNTKNGKDMRNKVSVKPKEIGGKTIVDYGTNTNKEGGGITSEANIFFLLYLFSIFA